MLVSRLIRDGVQIGAANWFAKEQVLIWNIPGVTAGSLTADQLKAYGGWPFTPDAEWLNLQTIAFYHFKTAIDRQGSVAARTPSGLAPGQVLDFFVAPVAGERAGMRRPALAGRDGAAVLLRRPRPVLREVRVQFQIVVAVLVELDVRCVQRRRACSASPAAATARGRFHPYIPSPLLRAPMIDGQACSSAARRSSRRIWCRRWPGGRGSTGTFEPWFLNSGRAVAFTAALLLVAGASSAPPIGVNRSSAAPMSAAGALVAMIIVLAVVGPGNLFPIVVAFGAVIAVASGGAGALAGWSLRRAMNVLARMTGGGAACHLGLRRVCSARLVALSRSKPDLASPRRRVGQLPVLGRHCDGFLTRPEGA